MEFFAIILMVAVMSSSEYLDNDILAMTNEFNRQLNYWAGLALKKIFGKLKVCFNKINMKQAGQFTTYIKILPKGGIQTYEGEAIVWKRIERTVLFTPLAVYPQLAKYGVQLERVRPSMIDSVRSCG
ncbi:unnamed protein product [Cylicocyclus nassatus]|uniref:Uncharacterized protein n=1 Tax=Cylicocyclus nassatus TaxID=53992 RepID=A0AA36DPT7_CYLNA|nr:unnamed protein product [Cylicocyclus nassatus]